VCNGGSEKRARTESVPIALERAREMIADAKRSSDERIIERGAPLRAFFRPLEDGAIGRGDSRPRTMAVRMPEMLELFRLNSSRSFYLKSYSANGLRINTSLTERRTGS